MGKLIMVRHGESEGNAIRRFTTSGEAKITELGRRQALEAASRIKTDFQPKLDSVVHRYPDDEIVIVSHGGVMRAVWAHVTGSWENAHVPPNCGIVVIEHTAGRYRPPEVVQGEA